MEQQTIERGGLVTAITIAVVQFIMSERAEGVYEEELRRARLETTERIERHVQQQDEVRRVYLSELANVRKDCEAIVNMANGALLECFKALEIESARE